MSVDLFVGIVIGFLIAFFVLKRSINKSGYGELKLCREKCPYYRSIEVKSQDGEDDDA